LFPSHSCPSNTIGTSTNGLSTSFFQSVPSHCSRVTPPLAPIKNSSHFSFVQPSNPLSSAHPPFVQLSNSPSPALKKPVSKPLTTPAPSIHPMITRSKSKQLMTSSPHALLSSLEPNSVPEALLDSRWIKAMEEEFSAL